VKHASVQATRLDLEWIQDSIVRLQEGEYRAVLEVNGTAGRMDDDSQREAVMAGFAGFLNALGYPIQILVRSSPVDLTRYIASLEERARQTPSRELAELAHDHALFVQGLARQRTLLERRFYVVVPAESSPSTGWTLLRRRGQGGPPDAQVDAARRQLTFRCEEVARQLARCGLAVRRLTDLELAQLYLACWSPERARAQRIRRRLDDYSTLAVRGAALAHGGE
jgi:hypothetical protein